MKHLGGGSSQTQIGPITIRADVISKPVAVVPEAQLIIGAVEAPCVDGQIGFAIAFEPAAGHHVQYPLRAVAGVGGQAPTLHLEGFDVTGMELRANVARNVGIGHRHAIHEP